MTLQQQQELEEIGELTKAQGRDAGAVAQRVENLVQTLRDKEKELSQLQAKLAKYEVSDLLEQVKEVNGVKVLAAEVVSPDMDALRAMGDLFRDKLGSGVVVLGSVAGEDKVNLLALVTKDMIGKGLHAGNLIKEVAKITGGGGGGRPDMAQAGGKRPDRLAEALAQVEILVVAQYKG